MVTRRHQRAAAALIAAAVLVSLGAPARAAPYAGRICVFPFDGPSADTVHGAVVKTLTARALTLVSEKELRQAALRSVIENPKGDTISPDALDAAITIEGSVKGGRRPSVVLVVRNARDQMVLLGTRLTGASIAELAPLIETEWWRSLEAVLRRFEGEPAPAAPAPQAAALPAPGPAPAAESKATPPAESAANGPFELAVGPRVLFRRLTYASDPYDVLSSHAAALPKAVGLEAGAVWVEKRKRFGITLGGELTAGHTERSRADLVYDLSSGDLQASLRAGYQFDWTILDVFLGGGRHWFHMVPRGAATSRPRLVPSVDYRYLDVGLHLRRRLTASFAVFGEAAYRHVLSAGPIASPSWFPRLDTVAGHATGGMALTLSRSWETRLRLEMRAYDHHLNSRPGDARAGTAARDQYISAGLELCAVFGGADR